MQRDGAGNGDGLATRKLVGIKVDEVRGYGYRRIAAMLEAAGRAVNVNGYCESFISKLRDELLNDEIFFSLAKAKRSSKAGASASTPCGPTHRSDTGLRHWPLLRRRPKPSPDMAAKPTMD